MREIVHIQAGQCGNQIGAKVSELMLMQTSSIFCRKCTIWNMVVIIVAIFSCQKIPSRSNSLLLCIKFYIRFVYTSSYS